MDRDLIVDLRYCQYVKALNFYNGKSYKALTKEQTIPIGKLSNIRDLNILIFLLSRKFLSTNKNSFSLNLPSPESLCLSSTFRVWREESPRKLTILYDNYQRNVGFFGNYNSSISFECSGSYFEYLIYSENKDIIFNVGNLVERFIKSINKIKDYE